MELRDENEALRARIAEHEQKLFVRDERIAEHERRNAERDQRIAEHEQKLFARDERISELEREIALLVEQLEGAAHDKRTLEARLKELLTKRRAIDETPKGQMLLAFVGESSLPTPPCAKEAPDGETSQDELSGPVERKARKNAKRKLAYEALAREHVYHEIAAVERVCALTDKPLVVVGEKTSEELHFEPARLFVVVHHRAVYGLSEADQRERKAEPIVAAAPVQPIEGAQVGASLLAQILVQKYCDHLPLYRQQAIFDRAGLFLPRQTMCEWVMKAAFNLEPIHAALKQRIVTSGVVQLDDTPVDCQGPPGEKNFQARLWTYASPLERGVVFDFTANRSHEHVLEFLGPEVQGYLVGDGYSGYFTVAKKRPGVIVAGCWAHVLRKFRDALEESPEGAASVVAMIRTLFVIEEEALEQEFEPEAVKALRVERSKQVLDRIRQRVDELLAVNRSEASSMSVALKYVDHQWPALTVFLDDGRVPIHNNTCERAIRPIAVGRNNWLFAGSERGGQAAAVVYSLIESCKQAGVEPWLYLADVLVRVATHPASRVEELIPDRWKALFGAQPAA